MAAVGPEIVVLLGGNVLRTVPVAEGVLTLGRLPDNSIPLEAPAVSRRHAEIRVQSAAEGGAVLLVDLGSSNGTFLNGDRLLPEQPVPLRDGAAWEIGPFTLLYRSGAAPGVTQGATAETEADTEETGGPATLVDTPLPTGAIPAPLPAEAPAAPLPASRPRLPAPAPEGPASRYLLDLPALFHDGDFLGRYLLLFEAVWEPLEARQDHLEMYFDPHTCPEPFLRWLAGWLGVALQDHWPEARRRRLLAEAMDLYRWRGTRYGLTRMLEVCTGLPAEVTEDPETPFVFRVRVRLPAGGGVDRQLLEELVRAHKPAHAGYVLEVQPA